MSNTVQLQSYSVEKVGIPFNDNMISILIPPYSVGTYLLFRDGVPIYVGRSDYCVRNRLLNHEKKQEATHFIWEPCRDRTQSFLIECKWFHELFGSHFARNQIHPAVPRRMELVCPYCTNLESDSLTVEFI